jgi:hypothetical protein
MSWALADLGHDNPLAIGLPCLWCAGSQHSACCSTLRSFKCREHSASAVEPVSQISQDTMGTWTSLQKHTYIAVIALCLPIILNPPSSQAQTSNSIRNNAKIHSARNKQRIQSPRHQPD